MGITNKFIQSVPQPVWLLGLAHCIADLTPGALYVALPFLQAKFSLSYAELGTIVLVQNIAASITQPLFGFFSDRKHRPWLMPIGCLLTGVFMTASLFATNYAQILFCIALSGFGNASFHPEAAKTVNHLSGNAKGRCISIFSVGGYGGVALGSLLLSSLLLAGSNWLLLLYALPSLIIFLTLIKPSLTWPMPVVRADNSLATLRESISWPLIALLGMLMTRATISSGLGVFVPAYYTDYLGGDGHHIGFLLTMYLAAGVIGTLIGGNASDRYGSKQVMLYSTPPLTLALYAFMHASNIWAVALLAFASILLSTTATSSMLFAQRMMPKNVGMASGLTLGFSIGLGTLGVTALGKCADLQGLLTVFEILAVLPLLGFVLTLFVREPQTAK